MLYSVFHIFDNEQIIVDKVKKMCKYNVNVRFHVWCVSFRSSLSVDDVESRAAGTFNVDQSETANKEVM